jgi:hypothetical protein
VTAPWAFKGAQIKTRLVRFDADQRHRCAASRAAMNSEVCSTKSWIGLRRRHNTPLENQAGARHPQSPIVAYDRAVIQKPTFLGSLCAGQYCSFSRQNLQRRKTAPRVAPVQILRAALQPPSRVL